MIDEIAIGVISALLVIVVVWGINRMETASRHVVGNSTAELETIAEEDAAAQLVALREQVRTVARSYGLDVADHATGHNPTIVTYVDGRKSLVFSDHAAYRRALERREAHPLHSRIGKRPRPISEWSEEALRTWLDEHAI